MNRLEGVKEKRERPDRLRHRGKIQSRDKEQKPEGKKILKKQNTQKGHEKNLNLKKNRHKHNGKDRETYSPHIKITQNCDTTRYRL